MLNIIEIAPRVRENITALNRNHFTNQRNRIILGSAVHELHLWDLWNDNFYNIILFGWKAIETIKKGKLRENGKSSLLSSFGDLNLKYQAENLRVLIWERNLDFLWKFTRIHLRAQFRFPSDEISGRKLEGTHLRVYFRFPLKIGNDSSERRGQFRFLLAIDKNSPLSVI